MRIINENWKLNELSDTRVLCGLINSFVPNLFPTEILMNDRWCINLVLRSIDKMLMCNSTMDSEDLVEAEPQSICAFFCYLFMMFYKYRQCNAVVKKYKNLEINIRKLQKDLDVKFLDKTDVFSIENKLAKEKLELENLKLKYDIKYFIKWIEKVQLVKESVHAVINNKFKLKFDWFPLEEDITAANLCFNQAINLTLTCGVSFYKLSNKEAISRDRQIIIRQKNNQFYYDPKNNANIYRRVLKLPNFDPVEIDPKLFPNLDIFVECLSNNKILKKGTVFLYQVFPGSLKFYHDFLIKACLENDLDAVQRLIEFFTVYYPNFIDLKEPGSLNTALHICASNGYFKILLYLLENYANVNIQNREGNTPLILASEKFNRECAKLLIEFGADINIKNNKKNSVLDLPIDPTYKLFIQANAQRLSDILPGIMQGNHEIIEKVIVEHLNGLFPLCRLKSRFINGTTLLHTCSYYGHYDLVELLLRTNDFDHKLLNPNIKDYKGATPLHRAKDIRIMKILIDFGADVNLYDLDGNTPIHVKCYGEKNTESELEAIELLIYYRADLTIKNKKKLLPIHMAAMEGRLDVLKLLNEKDKDKTILYVLNKETNQIGTSPTYLALVNSQLECADWLTQNGYNLRSGEANLMLYQILKEQVFIKKTTEVILFLCQNGCDLNARYIGGNTALHLAAGIKSDPDGVIKILVNSGAQINAYNDNMQTPLFISVQSNNPLAASALLKLNADFKLKNAEGFTAFDLIKDIDDWIKTNYFESDIKVILKSFEYKQARTLIRKISEKINNDFSSNAMLNRRNKTINSYINQHYKMLNSSREISTNRTITIALK